MKTLATISLAIAVLVLVSSAAWSATSQPTIATLTVDPMESITVPTSATLHFTQLDPTGLIYEDINGNTLATATNAAGSFVFYHNSTTQQEIIASAVKTSGGTNDVSIAVQLGGDHGNGFCPVVTSGTPVATAPDLFDGINKGYYSTWPVDWQATANNPATLSGSYVWTVTFTAQNNP
jgi:hypothetical protein